jgi:hypothetical protein
LKQDQPIIEPVFQVEVKGGTFKWAEHNQKCY